MATRCVGFDLGTANLGIGIVDRELLDNGKHRLIAKGARYVTTSRDFRTKRVTDDDLQRALKLSSAIASAIDASQPTCVAYEAYTVFDDPLSPKLRAFGAEIVELFDWASAGSRPESVNAGILIAQAAGKPGFVGKLSTLLDALLTTLDSASQVRGRGSAAKVMAIAGAVIAMSAQRNLPVFAALPADLKERFHARDSVGNHVKASSGKNHKSLTEDGVRREVLDVEEILRNAHITTTQGEHVFDALGHAVIGCEKFDNQ